MKNTIKEQVTFKDTEVLEIYLDLLYRKLSSDISSMQEWIVVDQFGNMIAQGFYDKQSAEFYAKNIPNASVEKKR